MNERIKELAEQAGAATILFDREGHYYIINPELQKFAELIVRECANAIQAEQDTGLYNAQQMAGMAASKTAIKDHFGVEE